MWIYLQIDFFSIYKLFPLLLVIWDLVLTSNAVIVDKTWMAPDFFTES